PPPPSPIFPYTTLFRSPHSLHAPFESRTSYPQWGHNPSRLRRRRTDARRRRTPHQIREGRAVAPTRNQCGMMTDRTRNGRVGSRSEEHTSELQSLAYLV